MIEKGAQFSGVLYHADEQSYAPGVLVTAFHPEHGDIGHMELAPENEYQPGRRVRDIHVDPQFRRMGIATGMWRHAKEEGHNPVHSSERTKAGDAWSKAVGDYYPPREIT